MAVPCGSTPVATPVPSAGAAGSHRKNDDPTPSSLRTVRSPPISRARRRLMASPSPVPPCWRVRLMSACSNSSKTAASRSAAIPGPVSSTRTKAHGPSPSTRASGGGSSAVPALTVTRPPRGVNLTALESRLSSTWRTRSSSP